MHTENFILNQSSYRHAIEAVNKCLPELDVVSAFTCIGESFTLFVETIDAGDGGRLMISS